MEKYEIQDDKGVIHSSTDKIEIDTMWDAMVASDEEMKRNYPDMWRQLKDLYSCKWEGDLKLVQVHRITR